MERKAVLSLSLSSPPMAAAWPLQADLAPKRPSGACGGTHRPRGQGGRLKRLLPLHSL